MARFLVTTREYVEGSYVVTADSAEEAKSQFGDPQINWDVVEQRDYMAYSVEVIKAEEVVPHGPGWRTCHA